jgi:hypothetical protein
MYGWMRSSCDFLGLREKASFNIIPWGRSFPYRPSFFYILSLVENNPPCLYSVFRTIFFSPLLCLYMSVSSAARPGILSMRERAKWDAWKAVEGSHLTYLIHILQAIKISFLQQ